MKILAIEKEMPGVTGEQLGPHLRAEAARAWELYLAGAFRELYLDRDRHVAVLMLECADLEAARLLLGTLPLVREGLITFDLFALAPYPGFARLFAQA